MCTCMESLKFATKKLTSKQLEDLAKSVKSDANSFDCKFVEPIPKEIQTECSICLETLKEPYMVGCCGNRFCKDCIEPSKPLRFCPLCKDPSFQKLPDKQLQRLINQKNVYCLLQDCGCSWKGQINNLRQHLDINDEHTCANSSLRKEDVCQYLPVPCTYCKEYVRRIHMVDHETNCDSRPSLCNYCNYKGPHKDLDLHYKECLGYPIKCKNTCCSKFIPRRELHLHLDNCLWEKVDCAYCYAGCHEIILRKDMTEHMEKSLKEHLDLISAKCSILMKEEVKLFNELYELERNISILKQQLSLSEFHCEVVSLNNEELKQILQKNEEKDIQYLIVTNVPDNASQNNNNLKSRFGQYGTVTCAEMLEDHSSAIIEYSCISEYRRAIEVSKNPGIKLLHHHLQVHPIYADE